MELSIRGRAVNVTDETRELVTRRIQLALDTFKDRMEAVSVYLIDLNGPKRGIDKLCQITVRVHGVGELVVVEQGLTLAAALNRASARMKYRISEAIRRAVRPTLESIRTAPAS